MATSWTDSTITAGTTKIRKTHIDELRTAASNEEVRRGGGSISWSETITADVTKARKTHVDELRDACQLINDTDCSTDTQPATSWTEDPIITAGTTKVRKPHIDELRAYVNIAEDMCLCDCDGHCACHCDACGCDCDWCSSHCDPH